MNDKARINIGLSWQMTIKIRTLSQNFSLRRIIYAK